MACPSGKDLPIEYHYAWAETNSMSSWKQVSSKQRQSHRKSGAATPRPLSEEEIRQFLSTYKTSPCPREDFHDHRFCSGYHKQTDRRRNPYHTFYDLESCENVVERMYHPVLFRTEYCSSDGLRCPFGKCCSRAHFDGELRNPTRANLSYEYASIETEGGEKRSMASYVVAPIQALYQTPRNFGVECRQIWEQLEGIQIGYVCLPLTRREAFLLDSSQKLRRAVDEAAMAEGLASVSSVLREGNHPFGHIEIQGVHVAATVEKIRALFQPPSQYFCDVEREYGRRVISAIEQHLNRWGRDTFTRSPYSLMELSIEEDSSTGVLQVTSINRSNESGEATVQGIYDKIQFWITQEGYDKFVECSCCCEEYNLDQGVSCTKGHFFCSVDACFEQAVSSQIESIRGREDAVLCAICSEPYSTQQIATHLSPAVWEALQKAIIDKRVEKESKDLQDRFDQRLEEKVQEVLSKYGNADAQMKMKAQSAAADIRNTIMNLCCPHCQVAYFDFTGCMAITCRSCEKSFCAYCHVGQESSRGAHEHVRQCLMNESANGSYYATEEEIVKAQRCYRTRKIKKYLYKFKKNMQNAIVIELTNDLNDVGIQASALFEVGYLQDEDY